MNALSLASIDTFRNQIIETDALTLCASLPPASVDLILTDPPYGSTDCSWDTVVPFDEMWAAFKRVIRPRGAVVMTAAGMFAHELKASNIEWWKYDHVWFNPQQPSGFIHARNRPMKAFELVLIFSNGVIGHDNLTSNRMTYFPQMKQGKTYTRNYKRLDREYIGKRPSHKPYVFHATGLSHPHDVLIFPVHNSNTIHPTQKPVALFEYLIKTYTRPGAIVLDPFAGSGTTAVAAKITGRDFICGDITPEYVELARRRVNPEFGKAPKRIREPEPLEDLPLFAVAK